jgi:hypothetical protein
VHDSQRVSTLTKSTGKRRLALKILAGVIVAVRELSRRGRGTTQNQLLEEARLLLTSPSKFFERDAGCIPVDVNWRMEESWESLNGVYYLTDGLGWVGMGRTVLGWEGHGRLGSRNVDMGGGFSLLTTLSLNGVA